MSSVSCPLALFVRFGRVRGGKGFVNRGNLQKTLCWNTVLYPEPRFFQTVESYFLPMGIIFFCRFCWALHCSGVSHFWPKIPRLKRNSWNGMQCLPNIGSKKACGMWIAASRDRKPFISCVLGMVWRGKNLGNTISNMAQGLVMTGGLILPFPLGNTFSRRLKPSLSKAIIALPGIFWLDCAENQNATANVKIGLNFLAGYLSKNVTL